MTDADQTPRYMTLVDCEAVVDGPTAIMSQKYVLGAHTTLTQTVVLVAGSHCLTKKALAGSAAPSSRTPGQLCGLEDLSLAGSAQANLFPRSSEYIRAVRDFTPYAFNLGLTKA